MIKDLSKVLQLYINENLKIKTLVFITVITSLLELVYLFCIRELVFLITNNNFSNKFFNSEIVFITLVASVLFGRFAFYYFHSKAIVNLLLDAQEKLRRRLYQKLSMASLDSVRKLELAEFNFVIQTGIQHLCNQGLGSAIRAFSESIVGFVIIITLAYINLKLLLLSIGIFSFVFFTYGYVTQKLLVGHGRRANRYLAELILLFQDTINGFVEFRSYRSGKRVGYQIEEQLQGYSHHQGRSQVLIQLPRGVLDFVLGLMILGISVITLISSDKSILSAADIAVFIAASTRLLPMFKTFSNALAQISYGISNYERYITLVDRLNTLNQADANEVPLQQNITSVRIQNLALNFNERYLFRGLNYTLEIGNIYGVVGQSGTGKTSFVNCILGLIEPSEGKIAYCTKEDCEYTADQVLFSVASQQPFVYKDTLRNNVLFSSDIEQTRISEEISRLGLSHIELDDVLDRNLLSGGERQRISFLRAIESPANILVLDEPTSALDQATSEYLWQILREVKKDKIIIVVTHKMQEQSACDTIIEF